MRGVGVPLLDQVGVEEDVPAKDGAPRHRVHQLERVVVRDKELHEPHADEEHQCIVQVGCERRKVVARLQRKEGQGAEHDGGQADGLEEHRAVGHRHDGAEQQRLHQGEEREEEQVRGVRQALPVQRAKRRQGADERHEQEPRAG